MMIYPEGMLAISRQHREDMMHEAQRWRLIDEARHARRERRTHRHRNDKSSLSWDAGTLAACGERAAEPAR